MPSAEHTTSCPLPLFDAAESRRYAEAGIAIATENRTAILLEAKAAAREIALSRMSRECSADDVAERWFRLLGKESAKRKVEMLGNAAGGIFKGREWEFIRYENSVRIQAHARTIRVWRYVGK